MLYFNNLILFFIQTQNPISEYIYIYIYSKIVLHGKFITHQNLSLFNDCHLLNNNTK